MPLTRFEEIIMTLHVKGGLPLETARALAIRVRQSHPGAMMIVRFLGAADYYIGVSNLGQLDIINRQLRQMRVDFTASEGKPPIQNSELSKLVDLLEHLISGRRS